MNNKHWLVRMLAVLLAFGLVAAACGDDDDEDTADDSADTSGDSDDGGDAGDADLSGETVLITGPERAEQQVGSINAALDVLEERTGLEITYTGSADWEAEINTQVAGGNPPNISIFPQPGKLADFARDGILLASSGRHPRLGQRRTVATASMALRQRRRHQFGVPVSANDLKSLVWYKPATSRPTATPSRDVGRVQGAGRHHDRRRQHPALRRYRVRPGHWLGLHRLDRGSACSASQGPDAYDQWVSNDVKFSDERVIRRLERDPRSLEHRRCAVFAGGGSIAATHHTRPTTPEGLANDQCMPWSVRRTFFSGFLPEGRFEPTSTCSTSRRLTTPVRCWAPVR